MIGSKLLRYETVDSTNSVAEQLASNGAAEGTVVLANSQTHGQGRMERRWVSPSEGGLWFSVILRPATDPAATVQLTLLAAVAVCDGIEQVTGCRPGIKWPNDLLVSGKKICGILCEMEADETVNHVIMGIGINVNACQQAFGPELQPVATSLAMELGRNVDGERLLQAVFYKLDLWYGRWLAEGFAPLRAAWKDRNVTINRQISVNCGDTTVRGQAIDIDEEGALVIRTEEGSEQRFRFGDVSIKYHGNDSYALD